MFSNLLISTLNVNSIIWIVIAIILVLILGLIIWFLVALNTADKELRDLKIFEENQSTCSSKTDCKKEDSHIASSSTESETEEIVKTERSEKTSSATRLDEHTATRRVLIKMLNDAGVKGVSRLKKKELIEKVKELNLEYPLIHVKIYL